MMITYIIFFSIGDPRTICLGFLLKLYLLITNSFESCRNAMQIV